MLWPLSLGSLKNFYWFLFNCLKVVIQHFQLYVSFWQFFKHEFPPILLFSGSICFLLLFLISDIIDSYSHSLFDLRIHLFGSIDGLSTHHVSTHHIPAFLIQRRVVAWTLNHINGVVLCLFFDLWQLNYVFGSEFFQLKVLLRFIIWLKRPDPDWRFISTVINVFQNSVVYFCFLF